MLYCFVSQAALAAMELTDSAARVMLGERSEELTRRLGEFGGSFLSPMVRKVKFARFMAEQMFGFFEENGVHPSNGETPAEA